MSTYQTDYSAKPAIGLPGQVVDSEISNRISRTLESSAGIAFGQPAFRGTNDHGCVIGATFTGTAAATALAGNTGNGTMGTVTVSAGAKQGTYALVIIEPGSNVGTFEVTDPDGVFVGRGTVASAFSAGGLAFTLADGATDFVSGDGFTIAVTFTADITFLGIAILSPAVPPNSSTPDTYPQYFTVPLMTMGSMFVTAGATVAQGDDVYWNPATKRFTNTTTHVKIPRTKFDMAGVDGDIVKVSMALR